MPTTVPIAIVDSFSSKPFAGNPAAVCLLNQELPDEVLQKIAVEMNLSETAFVRDGDFSTGSHFRLRWFTPTREVDLCGHATMAAAAVLFQCQKNSSDVLAFATLSGELRVSKSAGGGLSMDLPLNPPVPQDAAEFMSTIKIAVGDLPITACAFSAKTKKLLVELQATRAQLEALKPDITALQASHVADQFRGVMVTIPGPADSSYDFCSRYFAPWNGIPEDPVTGSAHTVLAPYWGQKLGKTTLTARQCSPRGGDLTVDIRAEAGRITITGTACVVMEGQLRLD